MDHSEGWTFSSSATGPLSRQLVLRPHHGPNGIMPDTEDTEGSEENGQVFDTEPNNMGVDEELDDDGDEDNEGYCLENGDDIGEDQLLYHDDDDHNSFGENEQMVSLALTVPASTCSFVANASQVDISTARRAVRDERARLYHRRLTYDAVTAGTVDLERVSDMAGLLSAQELRLFEQMPAVHLPFERFVTLDGASEPVHWYGVREMQEMGVRYGGTQTVQERADAARLIVQGMTENEQGGPESGS